MRALSLSLSPSLSLFLVLARTCSQIPPAPGTSFLTLPFLSLLPPFPLRPSSFRFLLSPDHFPPLYITLHAAQGTDKEGVSPQYSHREPGLLALVLRQRIIRPFSRWVQAPRSQPSLKGNPPPATSFFRLFSLLSSYKTHHHHDHPFLDGFPGQTACDLLAATPPSPPPRRSRKATLAAPEVELPLRL